MITNRTLTKHRERAESRMFWHYNIYTILWGLMIALLSLLPGKRMPSVSFWELLSFDKAAHGFVYGVFVFIMMIGFCKQYSYPRLRYYPRWYAIIIGIVYGGMIEIAQGTFLPDRYCDLMDFGANVIGCACGAIIFQLVYFKV